MVDNPYEPPAVTAQDSAQGFKLSWFAIVVSLAVYFFSYLAGADLANRENSTLYMIMMATLSSTWLYFDAKRVGVGIVGPVNFLIFFAWQIAVPIYLIYTRGQKGWGLGLLHAGVVCSAYYLGWKNNI